MSEPESPPNRDKLTNKEILNLVERIKPTADAEAAQVDVPDTRALEGEDDLSIAGHEWLKDKISRIGYLEVTRIVLLIALFTMVIVWLLSVGGLMVLLGWRIQGFSVSDPVAIAYMTTTTVSVLGLFKIAANWIFAKPESKTKDRVNPKDSQYPQ